MIEVKDKKELAQIKYINELTKSKENNLREVVKHALVTQKNGQRILFTTDDRQARFMFINYDLPNGLYKIIEDKNSCFIAPIQFDQDYPNVGFLVNWDKDTSYQKIGDYKQVDRNFVASEVVVDSLKVFPEYKFIINADYIYSIFKSNEKEFKLIHGDSFLPAYFNGRISPIIFKGDKVISIVMVGNYVKS
jgi:hypothetical protein